MVNRRLSRERMGLRRHDVVPVRRLRCAQFEAEFADLLGELREHQR